MAGLGVSPDEAYTTLKLLDDVWSLAAERMLEAVARRLARGITEEGWAERKARETLALRGELAGIMARVSNAAPAQVTQALTEAHSIGTTAAATLGRTAIDSRPEVVQTLATRLTGQLQGSVLPVIRSHTDLYQRAVLDSEAAITTGTTTRREEVARTVDRLLAEGADRFVDRSGRRWHLDAYARMAGRTVAGQTVVQGQLDQMVAEDRDLVIISDSARECERCRPWEGRVLSVTGASVGQTVDGRRVVGTVSEARGDGLWHPNCRHRADPYTPGLTRKPPPKADPEGAAEEQRLRALERHARELKRRVAVAQQLGDTTTVRRLRQQIKANSARIAQHADDTGLLRRRDRERPLGGGTPTTKAPARKPTPRLDPPKPEAPRRSRVEEMSRRTPERTDRLGGSTAYTDLVTYPDGSKLIRKVNGDRASAQDLSPVDVTDAEILGARMLEVLDVRAPEIHRDSPTSLWMQHMDGKVGVELEAEAKVPAGLFDRPDARRLGLADYYMVNIDRNSGNWIVGKNGDLVGIDHGGAWLEGVDENWPSHSPFARWLYEDGRLPDRVDVHPDDVAEAGRRLEGLREEFERAGRLAWWELTMARHRLLAERVSGTSGGRLW